MQKLQLSVVIDNEVYTQGLVTAHRGDAGYDLRASIIDPITIHVGETTDVPLGIITSFNENYAGYIYPRYGLAKIHNITLANNVGIIDSNYRDEWVAPIVNHGKQPFTIEPNMEICQVVFGLIANTHENEIEYYENSSKLNDSIRGIKVLGSSDMTTTTTLYKNLLCRYIKH